MKGKKRILVAPLDWGLGHATRCIPVIRELLHQNAEVIVAADGRPYDLLKREFPELEIIRFPSFTIVYPNGNRIAWKIIRQIPKIASAIFSEHNALKKIIEENEIDAIISDNRFGLFSKTVPCIFISHQIGILMPRQFQWASYLVYLLNREIIQRYNACWVPDYEGNDNLSGALSHHYPLPKNASFIGPLTRFKTNSSVAKEYDLLVILSGPEPQRTVLENILMEQLKTIQGKVLVVRGIPEKNQRIKISDSLSVVSSLDSESLNKAILASDIIISRPGYSTIMDLDALGKKAIFIPTPGQTEQEYLGAELDKKGKCYTVRQDRFVLSETLDHAKRYHGFTEKKTQDSQLANCIKGLLLQHQEK